MMDDFRIEHISGTTFLSGNVGNRAHGKAECLPEFRSSKEGTPYARSKG
uniref:Uncharacterized protein n=1 Tax=Arundo donax TaxID=35708 RepID=A0A0A8ZZE7_ARUDO